MGLAASDRQRYLSRRSTLTFLSKHRIIHEQGYLSETSVNVR